MSPRPRILHLAHNKADPRAWTDAFRTAIAEIGDLTVVEEGEFLSDTEVSIRIQDCDILVTSWGARAVPTSLATEPGDLRYICHLTGGMGTTIPLELIDAPIAVTNWGDAQARSVAEGAVALLLACLKGLRFRIERIAAGDWRLPDEFRSGMMNQLDLGIYGCGFIGRCFIDMVRPMGPNLHVFDPYVADVPDGCERVTDLDTLFDRSHTVAIHAGLSSETEGSVTARLLARLPDGGILINTGRGAIVDQEALFAELESGRIRAGLDVLKPTEELAPDHPARGWPNLILTGHSLSQPFPKAYEAADAFEPMHHICIDNLRRHLKGEPLQFVMDRRRYELST